MQVGKDKAEKFPQLLEGVLALLRRRHPIFFLATIAGYGLQVGVTRDGVADHGMIKSIEQHHIELLQALALSLPAEDWGAEPPESREIQEMIDLLPELADAFHQRRYLAVEGAKDSEERVLLALQERIRLHTQAVRNWGYLDDVIAISTELYSGADAAFEAKLGVTATEIIQAAKALIKIIEARLQERWKRLRRVFREHKINRIIKAYFAEHSELGVDPDEIIRQTPATASRDAVLARLMSFSDLSLPSMMTVSPEELAASSGLPVERAGLVLLALSLAPGALDSASREYFFMANPIWPAPVVLASERFVCPIPQAIFSHIHDVMRGLAERHGLKDALEAMRAVFLEQKVAALLGAAFPGVNVVNATKWRVGTVEFETDHLLKVDTTVFIVEDKSAALSGAGLRGAPDRMKRHLRDLVFDPSEQSARLEAVIARAGTGDPEAVAQLVPFGTDFSDVETVVRISVTLDDFSVLASAETEMREAGLMPAEMQLGATLNVADLKVVIDILQTPTFIAHYFTERARLQKALPIFADEMDYLGLYLETGFNFAKTEGDNVHLALTGMSKPIDRYYNSRAEGIVVPKPAPKVSPYFARLIRRFEANAPRRWLTVGLEVLRACSWEEQRKVERLVERLRATVRRNWRDPEHECSLMISPPPLRETVIVFHVFPAQLADRRRELAENLAAEALERTSRKRCIVISRNADAWDREYESILVASPKPPGSG